jgi:SET domain-containing protein
VSTMFKGKTRVDYPNFFIDQRLEIKVSQIHGLGVFANAAISNRTLIEASPVIVFHRDTYKLLNEYTGAKRNWRHETTASGSRHILMDYPFAWNQTHNAMAMGWGGLYNHSTFEPNTKWQPNEEFNSLDFYANRDIEPGEELLIRYLPVSRVGKLWFIEEGTEHMLGKIDRAGSDPSFRDLDTEVKKL